MEVVGGKIVERDPIEVAELSQRFYGKREGKVLELRPEEALYLIEMKGKSCSEEGKRIGFEEVVKRFVKEEKKLFILYNTYRDWRDRGLFLKRWEGERFKGVRRVDYPATQVSFPKLDIELLLFPHSMISILGEGRKYLELYANYWFGQLGVYKNYKRGELLKFDVFETAFLMKHCGVKVRNVESGEEVDFDQLFKLTGREDFFRALYEVYEDWRLRGFIPKTGYKFGAHFRIYFHGASPIKKEGKWVHSKHVLHVFPKFERMLISEWARAIRTAHSVRKTFILGIPGLKDEDYEEVNPHFIAYHRRGGKVIAPNGEPDFLILALSEDEFIGGKEFASAVRRADEIGLHLLLAINGRESDLTYYWVRKINLPGSKYEYYEINWFQP